MTDKATLLALAEKVEGLDGPDRELDFDICKAVRSYPSDWRTRLRGASLEYYLAWSDCALRYTASIDAALTLVPPGAHWGMGHDANGPLAGWAWVRAKVADGWQEFHSPPRMGFERAGPFAATPALALCAAALRARAETQP
jgi:hypothetical protein